ncbi:MAG: hypothetical protein ACUVTE_07475 [Candidatus Bathycorpusculaceae bacterium]
MASDNEGNTIQRFTSTFSGLLNKITKIQHEFINVISSILYVHLEENKCL